MHQRECSPHQGTTIRVEEDHEWERVGLPSRWEVRVERRKLAAEIRRNLFQFLEKPKEADIPENSQRGDFDEFGDEKRSNSHHSEPKSSRQGGIVRALELWQIIGSSGEEN